MMIPRAVLDGVVAGELDLAFRRWSRRMHVPGGTQRTSVGVISFEEVDLVDVGAITEDDARRAGMELSRLREILDSKPGDVYRVRMSWARADERVILREHLELIDARPGELAETIAASIGRTKLPFKADIRRPKELGLTESLRPGYRLSPRGRAVLRHLRSLDRSAPTH